MNWLNNSYHKKFGRCFYLVLLCALGLSGGLTGCGDASHKEQEQLVILDRAEADIEYRLVDVEQGDVIKTKKLRSDYKQLESMDLSFAYNGQTIKKVYVEAGDTVARGQLLAELDIGDVDSSIRRLEYQIARNTILLEHLAENENNDISSKWLSFLYGSNQSEEKEDALKESIAELQQKNTYTREDYEDAIEMDRRELEQIREKIAQSYLYAGMDGTVSYVKPGAEGDISVAQERIVSIIDGAEGIFVVDKPEYAPYFAEGHEVTVSILSGVGAGKYQIVPYNMEEWGEVLYFTFVNEEDSAEMKVGSSGSIVVTLGYKENVLYLPHDAIHMAGDKPYVYVIGEGNIREIKWIETGLYGDTTVEVVSGLTKGEKVILE